MRSWLRTLRELLGNLHQLRPHLRPNRWLVAAVMAASTLSALFEGIGIGLLVPMVWMLQTPSAELVKKLEARSGPATFTARQLRDAPAFAAKLKNPADAVSAYLRDRLKEPTRQGLAQWQGTGAMPTAVRISATEDVNGIIAGPSIWDERRFAKATIRQETRELLGRDPSGEELRQLNRLLLEDAYPEELPRRRKSYLHWLPDLFPGRAAGFYVAVFCVVVLAAIVAKNLVLLANQTLMAKFSQRIAANLRAAIFHRMQHAALHLFEERKAGELGNLFSIETIRTQNAVEYLLLLVQRCLLAVCYLGVMVWLSWELSLGLLLLALVVGGLTLLVQLRLKRQGDDRSVAMRELYGYLSGIFSGIRVVRATNAQGLAEAEFGRLNHRMAEVERRAAVLGGLMGPLTETSALAGAMALIAGAYVVLIQHGRLGSAELMIVGVVLIRMLPLLNQLYGVMGQISYTSGGVREAVRWLASPLFPARPFGGREWPGVRGSIRLEGVGYTYPNGTVALADVSFDIPAGQTVALVGASGSGKSTVASLLLRLREPSAGRIMADGVDYWDYSPASWHARLGMVEQEAFLFHDTVANNIQFGRQGVTPEQLRRAVAAAHLDDVIHRLPQGLETVVGERGAMFSGGQRQRLAIARAIVADPQLLILDEATSALDNVSERQVQAALDEARHQRTVVVIAHRLSTVRSADRIVVLDHGRVVEQGTWDELIAQGGQFNRLLQSAQGGQLSGNP